MTASIIRPRVLAVLLASLAAAFPVAAQEGPPVSVAIPDDFPALDAPAVVVRDGARTVILLKESEASAETLFIALRVLQRARSERPFPKTGEMLPVMAYALDRALTPYQRRTLDRTLQRLVQSATADLGSWGSGRAVRMLEN